MAIHPAKPIIVITGGAGYLGSQLLRDLAAVPLFQGYTFRIYDNLHRQSFSGLMDLPANGHYEFIEGDILDRLNLERAMQEAGVVIHLAAIVRTPLSFDHPEWTEQVNHWGTAGVVETALKAGVSRFIHASSSSVYGPGGPFFEGDPCRPVGPYAISKLKGETEVERGGERGLSVTILRLGTVFGQSPSLRFDAVANHFAFLAGVKRPLVIHGNGEQVRPLIHIRDASAALLFCLIQPATASEILNAATLHPSVNEIAYALQALDPSLSVRYTDQDFRTQISYAVDSSKLYSLGFEPQFDLTTGLQEMVAHWQGFQPALRPSVK